MMTPTSVTKINTNSMTPENIRDVLLEEIFLVLGECDDIADICVLLGKMSNLQLTSFLKTEKKKQAKKKK